MKLLYLVVFIALIQIAFSYSIKIYRKCGKEVTIGSTKLVPGKIYSGSSFIGNSLEPKNCTLGTGSYTIDEDNKKYIAGRYNYRDPIFFEAFPSDRKFGNGIYLGLFKDGTMEKGQGILDLLVKEIKKGRDRLEIVCHD